MSEFVQILTRLYGIVSLMAIVKPPSYLTDDRRQAVHDLGHGMILLCFVTGLGQRSYQLFVKGESVLELTEGPTCPTGTWEYGMWLPVLQQLAAPWSDLLDETSPRRSAFPRHSQPQPQPHRSDYAARGGLEERGMSGTALVKLLAETTASFGILDQVHLTEKRYKSPFLDLDMTLVLVESRVILLVDYKGRQSLVATMERSDLASPASISHRVGDDGLQDLAEGLRCASEIADPLDLIEFCNSAA